MKYKAFPEANLEGTISNNVPTAASCSVQSIKN